MAVATKEMVPAQAQESEAETRLRQAISDVNRQLRQPSKAELTQARDEIDRLWVGVSKEIRRLSLPLTPAAPEIMTHIPGEPSPERLAQLQAIDRVARLLDQARHAREQANLALYRLK